MCAFRDGRDAEVQERYCWASAAHTQRSGRKKLASGGRKNIPEICRIRGLPVVVQFLEPQSDGVAEISQKNVENGFSLLPLGADVGVREALGCTTQLLPRVSWHPNMLGF